MREEMEDCFTARVLGPLASKSGPKHILVEQVAQDCCFQRFPSHLPRFWILEGKSRDHQTGRDAEALLPAKSRGRRGNLVRQTRSKLLFFLVEFPIGNEEPPSIRLTAAALWISSDFQEMGREAAPPNRSRSVSLLPAVNSRSAYELAPSFPRSLLA